MSDGILASDLLKKISPHDQPILDLLMVDRNEMTKIQLANHFKRSRSDVGFSLERLKIGGHINQAKYNYGKWYAVNYDFSEEVVAKRPGEAVEKINRMVEEVAELKGLVDNLKKDRSSAISLMSKSWQHGAEDRPMILTSFVEMANKQFELLEKLNQGEE